MTELSAVLSVLSPMYVRIDALGHIIEAGPTLAKLRPHEPLEGRRFLEMFEMLRPRHVASTDDLMQAARTKLHMRFRDAPRTSLKGVLVPIGGTAQAGKGAIINLSFGISILDAVRDYSLTSADFAPTDLTMEMLYLIEAKSAAMEASRTLNQRLQGAKIAAEEQAFTDTLTGLKNRRAMDHVLDRTIASGQDFSLMHVDLDYFKTVNDTLGHAAGDQVLQHVARIMVEETRSDDTVARVGGDEFVILLHKVIDKGRLTDISQRLIARLEVPVPYEAHECRISCSIGTVRVSDYANPSAAQVMEDADIALYASKRQGRACMRFYDPAMRDAPVQTLPSGSDAQGTT